MRQKVFKKVKFVFIILMIINIVFLSYASLSASDGSAFVTKEIFESTLADFNARLTTFETGINTKIDSQVTSYLDRNGIWSGVEQTMSKPYKRYGITQSWHYMLSTSIKGKAGNNDYLFQDDIIVQNISKTGLCNVVFETLKLGTANITNWENNTEAPNTSSPNGYGTMMYNWTDSSGNFSDAAEVSSYRAKITVFFKFVEVVGSTNYEKVIFTVANSNPSVYSWSMSNSNYG